MQNQLEKAIFGAGCFWGVEAEFKRLLGVISTCVGYSGGHLKNPTYKDVCTNKTSHAEVVQVEFDPAKVSYEKLLDVFFSSQDRKSTRLNSSHSAKSRMPSSA